MLAVNERREAVGPGQRPDEDRPAVSAIAAVGPALGNVLFAPETAAAAAAVSAFDE
jgi:hypothetical protein